MILQWWNKTSLLYLFDFWFQVVLFTKNHPSWLGFFRRLNPINWPQLTILQVIPSDHSDSVPVLPSPWVHKDDSACCCIKSACCVSVFFTIIIDHISCWSSPVQVTWNKKLLSVLNCFDNLLFWSFRQNKFVTWIHKCKINLFDYNASQCCCKLHCFDIVCTTCVTESVSLKLSNIP